jgi:hypothetical protein
MTFPKLIVRALARRNKAVDASCLRRRVGGRGPARLLHAPLGFAKNPPCSRNLAYPPSPRANVAQVAPQNAGCAARRDA